MIWKDLRQDGWAEKPENAQGGRPEQAKDWRAVESCEARIGAGRGPGRSEPHMKVRAHEDSQAITESKESLCLRRSCILAQLPLTDHPTRPVLLLALSYWPLNLKLRVVWEQIQDSSGYSVWRRDWPMSYDLRACNIKQQTIAPNLFPKTAQPEAGPVQAPNRSHPP